MSTWDDSEEVEVLPRGLNRRHAAYVPVGDDRPVGRPTHVAGYDDLMVLLLGAGVFVTRDPARLDLIDAFISDNRAMLRADESLVRQIGMFYGDVLTHAIPGSYWQVIQEGYPEVVVGKELAVSVIGVAESQLTTGRHDLEANFAHLSELLAEQNGPAQ